jgi:hypothetical protein
MLDRSLLIVLLAICVVPLAAAQDSESGLVVHGTINVVLGNQHGMVVLTDSMLTAGDHQLQEPGQKLFRLDDHTVCTIAGFVSAPAPTPELYTSTSAIIHEYTKQLAQQPAQGIREKLTSLAHLFNFHLSAIATLRGVTGLQTPGDNYSFQLIVAGYDTDGIARIGRITLRTVQLGDSFSSEVQEISIVDVGKGLISRLGGQPDIAELLLRDPDTIHHDAALTAYAASLRQDKGQSLTIDQMKELAITLARQTGKSYPSVGGADQIAILEQGRVTKIEQQAFPEPPKVLYQFSFMTDSQFSGPNALEISPGTTMLIMRTTFDHDRRKLDGHYYFSDTFKDSIIAYDGGPLYFDKSNHVLNCQLVIGVHAKRRSETARHLADDFHWVRIIRVEDAVEPTNKHEVK